MNYKMRWAFRSLENTSFVDFTISSVCFREWTSSRSTSSSTSLSWTSLTRQFIFTKWYVIHIPLPSLHLFSSSSSSILQPASQAGTDPSMGWAPKNMLKAGKHQPAPAARANRIHRDPRPNGTKYGRAGRHEHREWGDRHGELRDEKVAVHKDAWTKFLANDDQGARTAFECDFEDRVLAVSDGDGCCPPPQRKSLMSLVYNSVFLSLLSVKRLFPSGTKPIHQKMNRHLRTVQLPDRGGNPSRETMSSIPGVYELECSVRGGQQGSELYGRRLRTAHHPHLCPNCPIRHGDCQESKGSSLQQCPICQDHVVWGEETGRAEANNCKPFPGSQILSRVSQLILESSYPTISVDQNHLHHRLPPLPTTIHPMLLFPNLSSFTFHPQNSTSPILLSRSVSSIVFCIIRFHSDVRPRRRRRSPKDRPLCHRSLSRRLGQRSLDSDGPSARSPCLHVAQNLFAMTLFSSISFMIHCIRCQFDYPISPKYSVFFTFSFFRQTFCACSNGLVHTGFFEKTQKMHWRLYLLIEQNKQFHESFSFHVGWQVAGSDMVEFVELKQGPMPRNSQISLTFSLLFGSNPTSGTSRTWAISFVFFPSNWAANHFPALLPRPVVSRNRLALN